MDTEIWVLQLYFAPIKAKIENLFWEFLWKNLIKRNFQDLMNVHHLLEVPLGNLQVVILILSYYKTKKNIKFSKFPENY